MENLKIEINEYYKVLNLHKAILEAKFHENPDNEYIAGSPIIAELCNEIVDLLARMEMHKKGKEDWTNWRQLCNQDYYKQRILLLIAKHENWKKLTDDEKKEKVRCYISPFSCSDDEMLKIVEELDHKEL